MESSSSSPPSPPSPRSSGSSGSSGSSDRKWNTRTFLSSGDSSPHKAFDLSPVTLTDHERRREHQRHIPERRRRRPESPSAQKHDAALQDGAHAARQRPRRSRSALPPARRQEAVLGSSVSRGTAERRGLEEPSAAATGRRVPPQEPGVYGADGWNVLGVQQPTDGEERGPTLQGHAGPPPQRAHPEDSAGRPVQTKRQQELDLWKLSPEEHGRHGWLLLLPALGERTAGPRKRASPFDSRREWERGLGSVPGWDGILPEGHETHVQPGGGSFRGTRVNGQIKVLLSDIQHGAQGERAGEGQHGGRGSLQVQVPGPRGHTRLPGQPE